MPKVCSRQYSNPHSTGAKNNAALAWFASAFCFSTAGAQWISPEGSFGDGLYAFALGGAVAILAFTLRRRLLHALRFCRRVAFVSGLLNGLLLHVVLTTFVIGLLVSPVASLGELRPETVNTLCIALLGTLAPWVVYWLLREERVRAWCATHSSIA